MKIEIKNLTREEVIAILNEAFKCPWWNKNNAIDITNKLFDDKLVRVYNNETNQEYIFYIQDLFKGLSLFINNGGSTNISNYDLIDGDYILQYSLFGKLLYRISITKNMLKI